EPFSLDSELLSDAGFEPPDPSACTQPERALENKELGRLLRRAIHRLPEPLRIAAVLHDIEGLQHKEIATLLNCPTGRVKCRLHPARTRAPKPGGWPSSSARHPAPARVAADRRRPARYRGSSAQRDRDLTQLPHRHGEVPDSTRPLRTALETAPFS